MNVRLISDEELHTMSKEQLIKIINQLYKQIKQLDQMANRSQSVYEIYKDEVSDSEVISDQVFSLSDENQLQQEVRVVSNPSSLLNAEEADVMQQEPLNALEQKIVTSQSQYNTVQDQTDYGDLNSEDTNDGVKHFLDDFDSYKSQMFLYGISEQNNKNQQDTLLLEDIMKQIKVKKQDLDKYSKRINKLEQVIKKHDKNIGILRNNQKYFVNVMNKKNLIKQSRFQLSVANE